MDIIDVSRVTSMCSGFTDEDTNTELYVYQTESAGEDVIFEIESETTARHVRITKDSAIELMAYLAEVTK